MVTGVTTPHLRAAFATDQIRWQTSPRPSDNSDVNSASRDLPDEDAQQDVPRRSAQTAAIGRRLDL